MRFHIHIDAADISRKFEGAAKESFGFYRDDFTPMKGPGPHAYPRNHLSHKASSVGDFYQTFDGIVELADTLGGLVGYIEGECVVRRTEIRAQRNPAPTAPPFAATLGELAPGDFRETEIHITAPEKQVNQAAARTLADAGFFQAHKGPLDDRKFIFTLQGTVDIIRPLYDVMALYLSTTGLLGDCAIKEERIRRFWLSDSHVLRPAVVRKLQSFAAASDMTSANQ